MPLTEIPASQRDACTLMVRQAETASLALHTAYRDQHGSSEALLCMACEDCAEFCLTPDGQIVCNDCYTAIGRWAACRELAS